MAISYEIHPRIGIARIGNSPSDFYLSPESVGGLPIECDSQGNAILENGQPVYVKQYKDTIGRIKRQAAKFYVFEKNGDQERKLSLHDEVDGVRIERIEWTVHVANKKPVWFTFSELQGDLEFGPENSYANQHVGLNNPDVHGDKRKALIIDPGPRSVSGANQQACFSRYNIPKDYVYGSFPPVNAGGQQIDSLGELLTDEAGHLSFLGGLGQVTGSATISGFQGAPGYWDDVADGFVLATLHLSDGRTIDVDPGWVIVGSPKYAPELVNITTLYDTMDDVAVRFFKSNPEIYNGEDTAAAFPQHAGYTPLNGFNPQYRVNFQTQVKPIIDRIAAYRWVADIPYLTDYLCPGFDLSDASEANKANRERYFSLFRVPVLPQDYQEWIDKVPNGPNQLFSDDGLPLMPLNSGDNSVTNTGPIYKFFTLSATQYFVMTQWARGCFDNDDLPAQSLSSRLDEASVGNCVGAPFSPGIEVTWSSRNAPIYQAPFQLKLAHYDGSNAQLAAYYDESGLSTTADEADGQGCEPGDMTKRMAIPWQADFQECTAQTPNISNASVNQAQTPSAQIENPPTYYVYWWPPQSPMNVVTGALGPDEQVLDAVSSPYQQQNIMPAGIRMPYQRGIQDPASMVANWSRLGFIVNQGTDDYPYFVEAERDSGGLVQYLIQKDQLGGLIPKG